MKSTSDSRAEIRRLEEEDRRRDAELAEKKKEVSEEDRIATLEEGEYKNFIKLKREQGVNLIFTDELNYEESKAAWLAARRAAGVVFDWEG